MSRQEKFTKLNNILFLFAVANNVIINLNKCCHGSYGCQWFKLLVDKIIFKWILEKIQNFKFTIIHLYHRHNIFYITLIIL